MKARTIVNKLLETPASVKRIRTLRDLQAAPDDLLCDDPEVAAKHQIKVPFWITRIIWQGAGLISCDIKSNAEGYTSIEGYPVTAYTQLKHILLPDSPPQPGDLPTKPPAWE